MRNHKVVFKRVKKKGVQEARVNKKSEHGKAETECVEKTRGSFDEIWEKMGKKNRVVNKRKELDTNRKRRRKGDSN